MKVLLVKAELSDEASLPKWLWLDRLCNGLLSWGARRGLFGPTSVELPWILVRPIASEFERVYLWTGKGSVPWAELPQEAKDWELRWSGDLSADEAKAGCRRFPGLEAWEPEVISPLVPGVI